MRNNTNRRRFIDVGSATTIDRAGSIRPVKVAVGATGMKKPPDAPASITIRIESVSANLVSGPATVEGSGFVVRGEHKNHPAEAPWMNFAHCMRTILGQKFYKKIVEPTVADAQYEYVEAKSRNECWKAKWIKYRVLIELLSATGNRIVAPIVKFWLLFFS